MKNLEVGNVLKLIKRFTFVLGQTSYGQHVMQFEPSEMTDNFIIREVEKVDNNFYYKLHYRRNIYRIHESYIDEYFAISD